MLYSHMEREQACRKKCILTSQSEYLSIKLFFFFNHLGGNTSQNVKMGISKPIKTYGVVDSHTNDTRP